MLVPQGQYVVTIFPPPGLNLAPKVIGPLTVPPSALNLSANFETTGALPEAVSFFSGSRGLQHNTTPFVLNGEPSTLTIEGCKNGSRLVYVQGVNTSSGQYETRVFPLAETPVGSGNVHSADRPARSDPQRRRDQPAARVPDADQNAA